MNYASWIEEQKLKKCFIIATLLSTIAGTFTTGINLYDRVLDKRKQSRLDKGQDDKIRDLERRVDAAHGGHGRSQNDLRSSLSRGPANIQQEYQKGYADLGPRFAEGDTTTQLQLQSQIIHLQSTVIALLEEALQTGQPPDTTKLYNASEFARQGTIPSETGCREADFVYAVAEDVGFVVAVSAAAETADYDYGRSVVLSVC
ncbi:hypothetical protein OQA88_5623 [Cercophora sp. LCS_1]